MATKSIFMSVGDDSGDLHAANLMLAMRELAPDVRFVGLGMKRMALAGLEQLEEPGPQQSAMWLHNVLRLGHYGRRLARCRRYLATNPVSLVLPVDFGGFNLCLCRAARRLGLPVFYYIPPQVWAHGRYRLKKLRKWVSRCGLIYPFEADLYRRWGVEAQYVGHPLFDELQRHPPSAEIVAKLEGRFGPNLVGLFPGSRRQEVRAHMPVLAAACQQVRQAVPDASFTLLCPPDVRPLASQAVPAESGIEVLDGVRAVELAQASRICLAKSGTVTLEIASQGTPMVIFYRMAPFVCFIGYGLAQVPYMGIVNNLAGRMVCPERPMSRDEPGWLAAEAIRLLRDREAHECCREELRRVIEPLARPGASLRAARSALELIEGAR